jgi:3-methyladenine DNA glycosylase AlkD
MTGREISSLARDVDVRLREHSSAKRKAQHEGYFPSDLEILGVTAAHIKEVERDLKKRMRREASHAVLQLARALLEQRTVEGRQVAFDMIWGHKPTLKSLGLDEVEELGRDMDNWVTVDTFSVLVAGPALREGRITDAAIRSWARSKDRWWRRAALVSTVALNLKSRGGTGDVPRTLEICSWLVSDTDDMVAKAQSWALREASKRDPDSVRAFLDAHDAVLPSRVKREVGNKLRTGLKNPR